MARDTGSGLPPPTRLGACGSPEPIPLHVCGTPCHPRTALGSPVQYVPRPCPRCACSGKTRLQLQYIAEMLVPVFVSEAAKLHKFQLPLRNGLPLPDSMCVPALGARMTRGQWQGEPPSHPMLWICVRGSPLVHSGTGSFASPIRQQQQHGDVHAWNSV